MPKINDALTGTGKMMLLDLKKAAPSTGDKSMFEENAQMFGSRIIRTTSDSGQLTDFARLTEAEFTKHSPTDDMIEGFGQALAGWGRRWSGCCHAPSRTLAPLICKIGKPPHNFGRMVTIL
jgi:hypothetical protein